MALIGVAVVLGDGAVVERIVRGAVAAGLMVVLGRVILPATAGLLERLLR